MKSSNRSEIFARVFLFLLLALAGFAGALAAAPALGLPTAAGSTAAHEIHARMPENGGWTLDTIEARAGQPIRLRLTSDDVLHSFAIGQMDMPPVDLHPGEWQEITLTFDKPGRYTYYCTRWCGRNHWRMRGTILVTGNGDAVTGNGDATGSGDAAAEQPQPEKPLYLQLGLDVDAPHPAAATPSAPASAKRGAALADHLPAWALDRQTYLETAPADLFLRLRAEPALRGRSDAELWDAVAYLLSRQTSPEALAAAAQRYATNCAACHGETGKGDGVMVEGLPRFDPAKIHVGPASTDHTGMPADAQSAPAQPGQMAPSDMGLSAPPDFTDPRSLLGASPALLEGKLVRGGMGTGMPYWGTIFTQEQLDGIVGYLYGFALKSP